MKLKIFLTLLLLLSSESFAGTKGNYFGIEGFSSNAKFSETQNEKLNNLSLLADRGILGTIYFGRLGYDYNRESSRKYRDSSNGYGASYRYVINENSRGFFFAPEIFYEKHSIKAVDHNPQLQNKRTTVNIGDRYGVKLGIGYDISDYVAFYVVPVGYARTRYQYDWNFLYPDGTASARYSGNGYADELLFGAGIEIKPNDVVSFRFDFTSSSVISGPIKESNSIPSNSIFVDHQFGTLNYNGMQVLKGGIYLHF